MSACWQPPRHRPTPSVGYYANAFPKLPPLIADMGNPIIQHHADPSLLPAKNHAEPADSLSVMFHSAVLHANPHLDFGSTRPVIYNGDALINFRDHIVRKRRINEGNPLPPPTPVFRRR